MPWTCYFITSLKRSLNSPL